MSVGRATSDKDRRRLKLATQRTTCLCGGQESAACVTRVNPKTISDYANTGNDRHVDTFMPVDVLADLILDRRAAGEVAPLLTQLCELAGGVFVPTPEVTNEPGVLDLEVVQLSQELLCLVAALTQVSAGSGGKYRQQDLELIRTAIQGLCGLRSKIEARGADQW